MSDVWRIFVVEGDETLNQSLVNSLRKDGYGAQGVTTGVDAVRVLWSEEFDIVICDAKTPGADGFELLQWLRAYRPATKMILIGEESSASAARMQALESGAVSYFEKPLDYRLIREELRRLLQHTGFSASLDSFDLLDVIQIINMSRKDITLLINTGLEERGVLCFQQGELIWAEYGILRGEEAFFALAAHKNGTVVHQPGNDHVTANVTQPLARLIFQAVQYRSKYANQPHYTGEMESVKSPLFSSNTDEIDDSPFVFLSEEQPSQEEQAVQPAPASPPPVEPVPPQKEWWERTEHVPSVHVGQEDLSGFAPTQALDKNALNALLKKFEESPVKENKPPVQQQAELPSWLVEQPTDARMPAVKKDTPPASMPSIPATPAAQGFGEWNTGKNPAITPAFTETLRQETSPAQSQTSSPEWNTPYKTPPVVGFGQSGPLYNAQDLYTTSGMQPVMKGDQRVEQDGSVSTGMLQAQRNARKNYATLMSALQALSYAIPGFVATGILSADGYPIAQVAADNMDIARVGKALSAAQKAAFLALEQGGFGDFEDMLLTSSGCCIFVRVIGMDKKVLQVLVTTRDVNSAECLHMMMNVEGAVIAALN